MYIVFKKKYIQKKIYSKKNIFKKKYKELLPGINVFRNFLS